MICYPCDDKVALHRVQGLWIEEARENKADIPCIVVGTKADLRVSLNGSKTRKRSGSAKKEKAPSLSASFEDGEELRDQIKAEMHLECSVLDRQSVTTLLETVLMIAETTKYRNLRKSKNKNK